MYTIQSPIEGFNGVSTFGSTRVEFKDGKAEIPDLNLGLKTYLKVTGYKIAGKAANDRTAAQQKKLDAAADRAMAPQRWHMILSTAGLNFVIGAALWLALAGWREHASQV